MSRLPVPGSDEGNWGEILNNYLAVSLKPDGTLSDTTQASLSKANSAIQPDGTVAMSTALFFAPKGQIMNDGTNLWQVTVNTSGALVITRVGDIGAGALIVSGLLSPRIVLQGL